MVEISEKIRQLVIPDEAEAAADAAIEIVLEEDEPAELEG
jgi:hypothetical protein